MVILTIWDGCVIIYLDLDVQRVMTIVLGRTKTLVPSLSVTLASGALFLDCFFI
jgi:hypothetical protein